jgi:hypothetical protein
MKVSKLKNPLKLKNPCGKFEIRGNLKVANAKKIKDTFGIKVADNDEYYVLFFMGGFLMEKRCRVKRTESQKLECLRKVILHSQEHVRVNDPIRIYSQYIRYALDEFCGLHFNYYTSINAKRLNQNKGIRDHIVPHRIIMKKLLDLKQPTEKNMMSLISRYLVICKITTEEDSLLSSLGLGSKMPDGWDEDNDSIFARYEKAEIQIEKITT